MKKKILLSLLLLAISMFALTGCGEVEKAKTAVNNMFTGLQNGEYEEMSAYIDGGVGDVFNSESDEETTRLLSAVFGKISYEIISAEKVDENTVNVTTSITTLDMKPIMQQTMGQALSYAFGTAFSENNPSDDEISETITNIFIGLCQQENAAMVTNEVVIKVINNNGEWQIDGDDALAAAMTGDLEAAAQSALGGLGE